jgi:hypothetical protein
MKINKLAFCLFFAFASFAGFSQKVYFVYLQTENEQAFYVKMNSIIHSSSASGYLIVGFPQNKWPEQNFSLNMNKKDHGYLLKNFGEKGWGLFDLQTLAIQMAISGSAKMEEKVKQENNDVSVFTETLSKAADDPSLKEKPTKPETEEKKAEPVIQESIAKVNLVEMSKDTLAIKPAEITQQTEIKKDEPKIEIPEQLSVKAEENINPVDEPYKPTVVIKRSESSTTEGFGLVYIDDKGNGLNDTIRLLIPNPKSVGTVFSADPGEEKKFLDIIPDTVKKKEETVKDTITLVKEEIVEKKELKKDCPAIAEESDFFTLRKNMAAAEGDENMLNEAKNYFKTKCFTTEHVKNLSLLFLNDGSKFRFFDLAYAYVTDPDKFSVLQNELKQEIYINRFKAILRN